MREYIIQKKREHFSWADIPALPIDCLLWTEPISIAAWAQICYDHEAIHVRLWAKEEHIRAEHDTPLGMPCEDSCLEFFFSPRKDDLRYFNIEFNPNICMYLGLCRPGREIVRLLPPDGLLAPQAKRTADGWEVAYRMPFSFVRHFFPDFAPTSGGSIRANCYKCGDMTPQPHYLSWNPVTSVEPDFHRPEDFGVMRFE